MNRIKFILMLAYTLVFIAFTVLIGGYYKNFHITRTIWIGISITFAIFLCAVFIIDLFFANKE